MQYHTGAYILALRNYFSGNEKSEYHVRMKSPKSKNYTVRIKSKSGSEMRMEISGWWTCQCRAEIRGNKGGTLEISLRHSDSGRSRDTFSMNADLIWGGIFYSSDGKSYPFDGRFRDLKQAEIYKTDRDGSRLRCDFELN